MNYKKNLEKKQAASNFLRVLTIVSARKTVAGFFLVQILILNNLKWQTYTECRGDRIIYRESGTVK